MKWLVYFIKEGVFEFEKEFYPVIYNTKLATKEVYLHIRGQNALDEWYTFVRIEDLPKEKKESLKAIQESEVK